MTPVVRLSSFPRSNDHVYVYDCDSVTNSLIFVVGLDNHCCVPSVTESGFDDIMVMTLSRTFTYVFSLLDGTDA